MKILRDRESLSDRVADAIVELIFDERLSLGEAIPVTAALEERFGVSRTVIREAIADLAGRGILRRAGRDYLVGSPGPSQLHDLLEFRFRHEALDALALTELREAVEVQAAKLAALRRSDDDLAALKRHADTMAIGASEAAIHEADLAFHRALAAAARSAFLLLVIESLEPLLRESRLRSVAGWRRREIGLEPVVEAHRAILRAVKARRPDVAMRAMQYHLTQTAEDLRAAGQGTSSPAS